jgi:hypothetical protein
VVQQDPRLFRCRCLYGLSIYGDLIAGAGAGAEAGDGAVDADAAGSDPALDLAPRA